jgi:hypothetical protein
MGITNGELETWVVTAWSPGGGRTLFSRLHNRKIYSRGRVEARSRAEAVTRYQAETQGMPAGVEFAAWPLRMQRGEK